MNPTILLAYSFDVLLFWTGIYTIYTAFLQDKRRRSGR